MEYFDDQKELEQPMTVTEGICVVIAAILFVVFLVILWPVYRIKDWMEGNG